MMEVSDIKTKRDVLLYIQSLSDKYNMTENLDLILIREIEKLNVIIKRNYGPPWVPTIIAIILTNEKIKAALKAQNLMEVKNILNQTYNI